MTKPKAPEYCVVTYDAGHNQHASSAQSFVRVVDKALMEALEAFKKEVDKDWSF